MEKLATYIETLKHAAVATSHANDRPAIESHLAKGALMFLALHRKNHEYLRQLVEQERRSYGWSFLSGEEGAAVEAAFDQLAKDLGY